VDPITRDFYEERRRKWRRSAFLRGFFLALLLGAIGYAIHAFSREEHPGRHIARLHIVDVIYSDPWREQMIDEIADDPDVAALVVHIDSPGGTVVGSEALYDALRDVAAEKPVVAVMDGVAASGGYLVALGADHLIARGNTITGSIGVILEYLVFADLLDRLGVGVETIRSSQLKAAPSMLRELTPEGRAAEAALVQETHDWFRALVGERRALDGPALDAVTNGRTFTGRMALDLGLIDALGDEQAALAYLESADSDLADLPVETWAVDEEPAILDVILDRIGINTGGSRAYGLPQGPRLMSILK